MAKVTRKRLARGSKLTADHVQGVLGSTATQLNAAAVGVDQYEKQYGTFRVNLHIPYIASDYRTTYTDTEPDPDVVYDVAIPFGIPFTLPPFQDRFETVADAGSVKAPAIDEDTDFYVLDEVSFSFDQRGEPAAIADHFSPSAAGNPSDALRISNGNSPKQGRMAFEDAHRLEVTVSILEKRQHYFHSDSLLPDREVFSAVIPSVAFTGNRVLRFNPFIISDVAKTFSPYKTYIFTIFCPALIDAEGTDSSGDAAALKRTLALVSIQASMKFKHKLVARDNYVASSSETQNIPSYSGNTAHKGLKKTRTAASQAVSITSPSSNAVISADDATSGVSKSLANIDDAFREKLKGGYAPHGELHVAEELTEDACYEVISVPLFQNRRGGGIISDQAETDQHFHATHAQSLISDRRLIPILHPMTIHHVILAWNWSAWTPATVGGLGNNASIINQSATYKADFGVAMLAGPRADDWKYENIANITLLGPNTSGPSTWDGYLIDRIKIHPDTPSPTGKTGITSSENAWDWELHQMRLLATGDAKPGYFTQGWPIFVGETWLAPDTSPTKGSSTREAMSDGAGAFTAGNEQYLEVKGILSDAGGLKSADAATDDSVLVGYQGCMVYIIGKKHLL